MGRHLSVAALLVADGHERYAINGGEATDYGRVIKAGPVSMQLHKAVTDVQYDI